MTRIQIWLAKAAGRHDFILAVMLIVAVFMMILPMPTIVVDGLIAVNLTLSLVLLMTSIYLREPLEFSVFPSLLLITTMYRLALTVSTSRLILLQHDAGDIVYAFGNFVVGGNLAVGIIVFAIITVVQFIVITKGAERIAEVGARFSLDAMPGKQMSIDGDMRAGVIDAAEAKRQRSIVQKESQLYGAMDGGMKFVKGDAIASIIVILVNIIGGVAIGVLQNGMDVGEAVTIYAVLSIGDGLVSQIPALIIAVAAGIIVTRVPGEERHNLAKELTLQIGRQPQALMIVAIVLSVFAVVPGFPFFVFFPLAMLVGGLGWLVMRRRKHAGAAGEAGGTQDADGVTQMTPGAEPMSINLAKNVADKDALTNALERLRWAKFEQLGIAVPQIQVQASSILPPDTFQILLYGEPVLTQRLPGQLALVGIQGRPVPSAAQVDRLPFGGFMLNWVDAAAAGSLEAVGTPVLRDEERIAYCAALTIDRFAGEFIGVQETRHLMDAMEARYPELVKELQRQLQISKVAEVLERLVAEGISIRDLRTVFEALIEWAPKEKDTVMLTEYARISLRRQIVGRHRNGQSPIEAWLVGEGIENLVRESIRQTAAGAYSTLPQPKVEAVLARIREVVAAHEAPNAVLLTAIDVRRFLRKFVEREMFGLQVLSYQELGDDADLKILGSVELAEEIDDAYA
ncbi:secretion system apparatus protein SsaV [Caballeronia mineralivorans PML1(12)]|uniref:Secretion system apparatus protein SsaV n=1 Tax=Caballeronia mineralivorans PML1(12) TaxID=908627 RepID=A0A0J1FP18_9BURK|nr:EscV/YscV/HrcV family type III secretion system export apparatus protein [Caballeronia mineralivorans]KLU21493.1 secretion system apparatus protein SsaV [Caballeronia mineralivorans PML1(12)]